MDKPKNPDGQSDRAKISGLMKMDPEQHAAHLLAVDLADAAQLHDFGLPGMTEERLQENRNTAYMVARNGIEQALGYHEPFATKQIAELRADGQLPPEPQ